VVQGVVRLPHDDEERKEPKRRKHRPDKLLAYSNVIKAAGFKEEIAPAMPVLDKATGAEIEKRKPKYIDMVNMGQAYLLTSESG
jgi:hypothetical protein